MNNDLYGPKTDEAGFEESFEDKSQADQGDKGTAKETKAVDKKLAKPLGSDQGILDMIYSAIDRIMGPANYMPTPRK
jgi:hypothetical protein